MTMKLDESFYKQDVLEVAQALLGKIIVREVDGTKLSARIIDCEAYPGIKDRASHTYNNLQTGRTSTMFNGSGHLYVYLIYGLHSVANIVCGPEELGGGVMLRAVEPVTEEDYQAFSLNRFGVLPDDLSTYQQKNLLNGPGKLTQALQISTNDNGIDLLGEEIYLESDGYSNFEIGKTVRIGIDYAQEDAKLPYRFYIKNHPDITL